MGDLAFKKIKIEKRVGNRVSDDPAVLHALRRPLLSRAYEYRTARPVDGGKRASFLPLTLCSGGLKEGVTLFQGAEKHSPKHRVMSLDRGGYGSVAKNIF